MSGHLGSTLGALLCGVCLNTYLYGLVTYQYGAYFSGKFEDPRWMKALVGALCFFDTFHSVSVVYMLWMYLVDYKFEPPFIIWPLPLSAILMSVIAYTVQCFLALRTNRLVERDWLLYLFLVVSTGTMVLGVVGGAKLLRLEFLHEFQTLKPHLTVWLSLEVALDTSLTAVLLITLHKSRTGFRRSDAVLKRLARSAVQSGAFASIFAILALSSFLALPNTLLYATFGIPLARTYTCTLMDTLLCRKVLRGILNSTPENSRDGLGSVPTIRSGRTDWQLQIRKDVRTEIRFEAPELSSKPATPIPLTPGQPLGMQKRPMDI